MDLSNAYTESNGTLVTEASTLSAFPMNQRYTHPETGRSYNGTAVTPRFSDAGEVTGWDVRLDEGKPLLIIND